ncbi:MAG: hypothetical protein PHD82_01100 [Candidatus Riflebacteria bacterium]|nr:hypothetical protein [Candidatus Riflebacteria bacterium]
MQKFVTLFHAEIEGGTTRSDIARVPELVKAHPQGCFRSALFSGEDTKNHYGPLTLVFAIRRARDLLLEGCDYNGLDIQVEAAGRKLPQLPVGSHLVTLLNSPDTVIHINGNVFKPATEVFGFQQVYDDSVRCIEALKKMGFSQETMSIYATPEEISVEVHGGAIGCEGEHDLAEQYYRLLCFIAGIKASGNRPAKHEVKTILLNTCNHDAQILLPGSTHPTLHRPRVGVGASHFAYGIAAFSDFCGKKRTLQECLQETFTWVKFIQAEMPAIEGLKARIAQMAAMPKPGAAGVSAQTHCSSVMPDAGGFQPLKSKFEEGQAFFKNLPSVCGSFSSGLDKTLGGGWLKNGVHIVAGPRESGKSALLLQQALLSEKKMPVLYISYEHSLREFMIRATTSNSGLNLSEVLGHLPLTGAIGETARNNCTAALEKLQSEITSGFYFSGIEAGRDGFDPLEMQQLAAMIPGDGDKLVIVDSVCESDFGNDFRQKMRQLREIAASNHLTFIISIHYQIAIDKRPHFIEDTDIELLDKFQRFSDSVMVMETEKNNLRRFVAMIKGQIDAQLVSSLEQKALQIAGNKRYKTDTFSLMRLIHTRNGRRDLVLFLYQPEIGKFFELASLAMNRP